MRLGPTLPGQLPSGLEVYRPLLARLAEGKPAVEEDSLLADAAVEILARPGFDVLVSLPRLRFEPYPHQLDAAATVLRRMRGRAILADEVGLGKTIEAGLVMAELFQRRLATRVLILVPVGLVQQWAEELDRKFALPVLVQGTPAWERTPRPWEAPLLLLSLATARRDPLRSRLAEIPWDLVVVDEAHRLKNPQSASARLVKALRSRYLLLLTATPVENRLDDLYQLVNLVRPGFLGTPTEFRARHGAGRAGREARGGMVGRTEGDDASRTGVPGPEAGGARGGIANLELLQARMREVMVRHRRSEVALMLPRRLAQTRRLTPQRAEADLYALVSQRVRREARGASPAAAMTLRTLQRMAGSSPRRLAAGLRRAGWADLASLAEAAPRPEKAQALIAILERHRSRGEKVVVFTAFRETLGFLADLVEEAGFPAAVYHGSLSRRDKDAAIRAFEGEIPVLLTTEASGEGRNLQFCHVMVNFDLPWNPMQIEQRLGRIHRIGQEHDVLLTNLVNGGTVEEEILRVLEARINLFELVVGELDMILGRVEDDFDFETFVFRSFVESQDEDEFRRRLEEFGEELAEARRSYVESRARNDLLVADGRPA